LSGQRYQLVALLDVGVPITNCIFTFGEEVEPEPVQGGSAGGTPDAGVAPGACEPDAGFGASCTTDADCTCAEASFCGLMPGQTVGFCTATGCNEEPSVCPSDWSCFDISIFAPGEPAICLAP
jgi:hypothetical protein